MPTIILEKIKQANGKTYALVDAADVEMPDGKRLSEVEFGGGNDPRLDELLVDKERIILEYDARPFETDSLIEGFRAWSAVPALFKLEDGKEYKVQWGEEVFTCTAAAMNLSGIPGIGAGNASFIGLGDDTKEPFLLGYSVEQDVNIILTNSEAEENSFGISVVEPKVSENFLPATATTRTPVSIDMTEFSSKGIVTEIYEDGSTFSHTIEVDLDGKPVKITDSDGKVLTLTW